MAIAFDAATTGAYVSGTSKTWSHTCTGSDGVLIAGFFDRANSTPSTTVTCTYNGVSMTRVNSATRSVSGRWMHVFLLVNPATGAHNIVASADLADYIGGASISYTGCAQTGQPDATAAATASFTTSKTQSLTTIADNCWAVLFGISGDGVGPVTAGTGTTKRADEESFITIFDSNAALTPAGSKSLQVLYSGTLGKWGDIILSLAPVASGPAFLAAMNRVPLQAVNRAATY